MNGTTIEAYIGLHARNQQVAILPTHVRDQFIKLGRGLTVMRNRDLFKRMQECSLIFIPINVQEERHWVLSVVRPQEQLITMYDSGKKSREQLAS